MMGKALLCCLANILFSCFLTESLENLNDMKAFLHKEQTLDTYRHKIPADSQIRFYNHTLTNPVDIRYVTLEHILDRKLAVCELQIFEEDSTVNLAYQRPVNQSSVMALSKADYAVNGKVDTIYSRCWCCSVTNVENNAWLRVNLGQMYRVSNVVIYGRTERLQYKRENLNDIKIYLHDHEEALGTYIYKIPEKPQIRFYKYTLTTPVDARYVTLENGLDRRIFVCELEVYKTDGEQMFSQDGEQVFQQVKLIGGTFGCLGFVGFVVATICFCFHRQTSLMYEEMDMTTRQQNVTDNYDVIIPEERVSRPSTGPKLNKTVRTEERPNFTH